MTIKILKKLVSHSVADLPNIAKHLITAIGGSKVLLFKGEMGVGKTTLIKSICAELEIADDITSPTFSLVNEYSSPAGPVYHFDLYRLKNVEELYDIGYEEYLYSGYLCLVEWPEMAMELMPAQHTLVEVRLDGTDRIFSITDRK